MNNMAKMCIHCKSKIGFLDGELEIREGEFLCYGCVEDIAEKLSSLYDVRNADDFSRISGDIMALSEKRFKGDITSAIGALVEKRREYLGFETEEMKKAKEKAKAERLKQEEKERLLREEHAKSREENQRKEQEDIDNFLKENGHGGYYEYKILNICDDKNGNVNISEIYEKLNYLGRRGWQLKCAFSNELGKNSSSVGFGGISGGVNVTVEQNVLILERFIKFK